MIFMELIDLRVCARVHGCQGIWMDILWLLYLRMYVYTFERGKQRHRIEVVDDEDMAFVCWRTERMGQGIWSQPPPLPQLSNFLRQSSLCFFGDRPSHVINIYDTNQRPYQTTETRPVLIFIVLSWWTTTTHHPPVRQTERQAQILCYCVYGDWWLVA